MDNFKFGLFDIFTYTLPGFVIFFSLLLLYHDVDISLKVTAEQIVLLINNFSFNSIIFLFILSYIIGFIMHFFGYLYFDFIGKRLWSKKISRKIIDSTPNDSQLVLTRHYSKENFIYIELWYALRGMSYNLSLAFLFLAIILISKIFYESLYQIQWIVLTITCFCSSIILLDRAVTFHIWCKNTISETNQFLIKKGIMN